MSIKCKNCLAELGDDSKFCPNCGTKVEAEEQSVTAEPTAEVRQEPVVEQAPETVLEEAVRENEIELPASSFSDIVPETDENKPETEQQVIEQTVVEQPADIQQPVDAPIAPPMTKSDLKNAKNEQERRQKAAQEAEKLAQKQAEEARKREAKAAKVRKATPLGITASVFLSLFLIVNLVICFVLVTCIGITSSDASNFALPVGNQNITVDLLSDSTKGFGEGETREFLESLVGTEDELTVVFDGEEYELNLEKEAIDAIENVLLAENGIAKTVSDTVNTYLRMSTNALIAVSIYVAVVILVLVLAIFAALGKQAKAFLVPGIIFTAIGIAALAFSVLGVVVPSIFGIPALTNIMALDLVATFALIASAVISVIGILLVAVGSTGKKTA